MSTRPYPDDEELIEHDLSRAEPLGQNTEYVRPSAFLQVHPGDEDHSLYGDRTSFDSRHYGDNIRLNDLSEAPTRSYAPYPSDSEGDERDDIPEEIDGETGFPYVEPPSPMEFGYGDEDAFDVRPLDGLQNQSESSLDKEWVNRQKSTLNRFGTRKITLRDGALSAEYNVPTAVHQAVLPEYRDAEAGSKEFTHVRYTAATCDPDDFSTLPGYGLRASEYERETELLITITYYNEDKELTARTLYGVMQNIRDICNLRSTRFWNEGGEAWKKIVVVLVMDGIGPCDKSTLDMLATIGLYQDGVLKKSVDDKDTVAHIFEYTTQLCVSPSMKLVRPVEGNKASLPPIQMILCLKQENSKKINSHRWVFNAFCPILKPEVVCLLDAGTKPGRKSILNLWKAFYNDRKIGGACGEIHAMLGPFSTNLMNPLVAAQNFEYKISNILDKPLESMFGYISVLPGAFSAYRYSAVEGRPLEQYFHGDHTLSERLGKKGMDGMSIFRKNMFLAEDRILCFEVVFKRGCKWKLTYVKASKAETDVPDRLPEFIGQRRRWLNGSFAAGIYGIMHFYRIYRSGHNILRMLLLHFQFMYNCVQQTLTWFNLACYYLTMTIIVELAASPADFGSPNNDNAIPFRTDISNIISIVLRDFYLVALLVSLMLALGNKPKSSRWLYYTICVVFAVISVYSNIIALWLAIRAIIDGDFTNVAAFFQHIRDFYTNPIVLVTIALLSTYGLYILSALFYLDPWHLITSMGAYMCMMPNFVNVLNVYSFCNWHDVSWGTKGSDQVEKLPAAQTTTMGSVQVVEEAARPIQHIDADFQQVVKRALAPFEAKKEKNIVSDDDQTKMFRTYLIVVWLVSNLALVWAITTTNSFAVSIDSSVQSRIAGFFSTLLWSNAALAAIRFCGNVHFVTKSLGRRLFSRK